MPGTLLTTDIPGTRPILRGKVRDLYAAGDDLLFVATDRISAFDHVLGSGIPDKGKVLTQISLFWFHFLASEVPNHLITAEVAAYPAPFSAHAGVLQGRSMLVRRAEMFPIECVVRGYLSGSAWTEYKATGSVCGISLPAGLRESDPLPDAIFTPATKSPSGEHDINISFDAMAATVGGENAEELRRLTLLIYRRAAAHASGCGMILADTKFEFGRTPNGIVLADEVLTPDSSRYWPKDTYAPGGPQISFDKQFVRDHLERTYWNKQAPAPSLPDDVVERTREKYLEAFRRITGRQALE